MDHKHALILLSIATAFSIVVAEAFDVGVQIPTYLTSQLQHFNEHPLAKGE
jgi:hypothetical protein